MMRKKIEAIETGTLIDSTQDSQGSKLAYDCHRGRQPLGDTATWGQGLCWKSLSCEAADG